MRRKTQIEAINDFIRVHSDKYNYEKVNYINDNTKVIIICKQHGEFSQKPNKHLFGRGCRLCANKKIAERRKNNTENFIKESCLIHNNKYNYSKVIYKEAFEKVIIICKKHGEFLQRPNDHKQKNGCPSCADENKGYSRNNYINQSKGRECKLYILRCFNENEEFFKIGITMNSVKKRYSKSSSMPYTYEIIYEEKRSAAEIYDLEKILLKENKKYKHIPKNNFKGYTECFTNKLPVLKIMEKIKNK